MSFINTVFSAEPICKPNARITTLNEEFDVVTDPTTPEVVAGYVRLVLTVIGTLATLLPGLEIAGVPIMEWIKVVFGSTC